MFGSGLTPCQVIDNFEDTMNSSFFSDLLTTIADRGRELIDSRRVRTGGTSELLGLCDALLSERGEASGVALAADILDAYGAADGDEKIAFFDYLTDSFGPDDAAIKSAIDSYQSTPGVVTANTLHDATEPRRQELIRRLNLAPGGTGALVAMRGEMLALDKQRRWEALDRDFQHLFRSWFNRGFLVLRRIDWQTPAAILEKIIEYEAVHAIGDWDDLRRRIDPADRRLYAFFHPALVDEPLIFVEVALDTGIPDAIEPILASDHKETDFRDASTAVFYSISNCQSGLRGISFGHFLIKQVVEELARDYPKLKTFVTLSPVPGFGRWLRQLSERHNDRWHDIGAAVTNWMDDHPDWPIADPVDGQLTKTLTSLLAHYLIHETTLAHRTADPVARFHLGNGARLERINWLADTSSKGLHQSFGFMVNYQYELKDIERNHDAFANDGVIAASNAVLRQAKALAGIKPPVAANA